MSSTKNRRDEFHTDHFVSGKEKRAERRAEALLRRAHDLDDDDWDDVDFIDSKRRFKRNQRLE